MTARTDRRINWLLASYPRSWRARYGEEFAELLAAEYAEHHEYSERDQRSRSRRHAANIIASGLRARLADAGLTAHPLDKRSAVRASLAALIYCGGAFAMFGTAMWAHLLAHQALVPAGAAAFGWSTTMGITSYVAHLGALASFPATQIAWMALSLAAA